MAGIVHVNMGHCLYYHITARRSLVTRGRAIAYKYQQLPNVRGLLALLFLLPCIATVAFIPYDVYVYAKIQFRVMSKWGRFA